MLFLLFKRQGEWNPVKQPKQKKEKRYPMNQAKQIIGKQKSRIVPHKSD
ncbi:hypothetical protein [Metabacillus indicus]